MTAELREAVIGYRLWIPQRNELCALTGEGWRVGDQTARCLEHDEHSPPEADCGCGFYALHRKPSRVPDGTVVGAVLAWGRLQVHFDGFRATHARPLALARAGAVDGSRLEQLAARYGVPVVGLEVLDAVAGEFGAPVPLAERPADETVLFRALADALIRRERCLPAPTIVDSGYDALCHGVLRLLETADGLDGLESLLLAAWQVDKDDTPRRPSLAMSRLRTTLVEALTATAGPASEKKTGHVLRLLDSAHGPVRGSMAELARRFGAHVIPERYLFDPNIAGDMIETACEQARRKLDERQEGLLPLRGGDDAVLLLEPRLEDDEVERLLPRMRSSVHIDDLLEQAHQRRPQLAYAVLRLRRGIGVTVATRHLGRRARPLLLGQLHRNPWAFSLRRDPLVDEILGPNELRAAAERSMRLAGDATDIVQALALLPGEEARDGLRRLISRINRLDRYADNNLRFRAWNLLCSREHLVRLFEPDVVEAALHDETLDSVNQVLLLRAHPDADHAKAQLMWEHADLTPRFALDVLRATGPTHVRLAREALERAGEARVDNAQAARTAAAVVVAAQASESRDVIAGLAADPDLPATVRAVACFVTGSTAQADPAIERYRRWQDTRRRGRSEPLVELLSGVWQAQVVL